MEWHLLLAPAFQSATGHHTVDEGGADNPRCQGPSQWQIQRRQLKGTEVCCLALTVAPGTRGASKQLAVGAHLPGSGTMLTQGTTQVAALRGHAEGRVQSTR